MHGVVAGSVVSGGGIRCLSAVDRGAGRDVVFRPGQVWVVGLVLAGLVAAGFGLAWGAHVSVAGSRSVAAGRHGWESVPLAARGPVSEALGAAAPAYRVRGAAGRLVAINRAQRLSASFGRGAVVVRQGRSWLGFRLAAWGYGSSLTAVGAVAPRAAGNRVVLSHDGVREWWANGPLGLEQGFTLAHRPVGGGGLLSLSLALSGDLRPVVQAGGRSVVFGRSGRVVLAYRGLVATDARGRALHAWLGLRGRRLLIRVDGRGAVFPVRVDPLVQLAKLTASDGSANDGLGESVAVSADGSTVVAGVSKANSGQGTVYVFTKPAGGWSTGTQAAKLTAADGVANDELGFSVAVSADGSTVVGGARFAKVGGNSSQGAAYVFVEPGGGWGSATPAQAKLTASDGAANDQYGYSVAVSGDGSTAAVGNPFATVGGNAAQGAAYVFVKPGGGWTAATETAKLTASDGAVGNRLGISVQLSSDGSTAAVGASGVSSFQGAIYVFVKPAGAWGSASPTQAKLTASDGAAQDQLGDSVGVSGDGSTVVAGAFNAMIGSNSAQGAGYVFIRPAGGWADGTQAAKLTASDGAASDLFGLALTLSADGSTVVAGARSALVGSNASQGAAYAFSKPAGGWGSATPTQTKLTASDGAAGDFLGSSVAVSGDGATVVTGSAGANIGSNSGQGAAYVFGSNSASPGLSLSAPSSGTAGSTISASSISGNLSSGFLPSGTITFKVFGPQPSAPTSCGSGGTTVGTASVGGNGTYHPGAGFTPSQTGNYWWYASYGGDSNNHPAASSCGVSMPETVVSAAPGEPRNAALPAISGTAKAHSTLSCSAGSWTGHPIRYSYQWSSNGTAILGATAGTFKVRAIDEGTTLTCTVTAFNASGSGPPATSNGVRVPVPRAPGCPAATGSLKGMALGLSRLGMTRAQARRAYTHSSTRGKRYEDFFCLTPRGVRVGYTSPALLRTLSPSEGAKVKGRVIWASTSNGYYDVHGVRPGATVAAAGKRLKLTRPFQVGLNTLYLAPNGASTAVLKVRHGIVEEIGIGDKQLTQGRKAQRYFLTSFS